MFRVGDLRKRILFTLLMILLYRIGAFVPAPGIDVEQEQLLRDRANQGGVLAFLQLFSDYLEKIGRVSWQILFLCLDFWLLC